jgi:hypothetical protein
MTDPLSLPRRLRGHTRAHQTRAPAKLVSFFQGPENVAIAFAPNYEVRS